MKKLALLVLCAVAAAPCARAQEMNVIRMNDQVDQFNLAEIDSVTFGVIGPMAGSALRGGPWRANDVLRVHTHDETVQFPVAEIDSLCFAGEQLMTVYYGAGATDQFNLAEVDSMTFASGSANIVSITYSGGTAIVDNPLESAGVLVEVVGAHVTVRSTAGIDGIEYTLSGTTADGMFKIYSDADFTLRLVGVQITNLDQPAINIQSGVEIAVELADGTASDLTDGLTYATAPDGEDQKAAFFSEGQLSFSGSGSMTIHGRGSSQHGLGSDNYIDVLGGAVVVQSAVRDGIHTNDGFFMQGGSLDVSSGYDGIDGGAGPIEITGGDVTVLSQGDDRDAVKCSGAILIAGGEIDLTVEGDQSKALNAADVQLTGGTVTIGTSGGVVLEPSGAGYDPSYCTGIKADGLVLLDGCALTITAVGRAGRGISSNDILVESGTLNIACSGDGGTYTNEDGVMDAYHGPCLNADGDVTLNGGALTLSNSGDAGKGIGGDSDLAVGGAGASPTLQITTTGQPIYIGNGEYAEAKAISVDSLITIDGGELTISSADDAIKSKVRIDINDGLINITQSVEGIETPNMYINGGEIHVTSTDDGLNATYGIDSEYDDGSVLIINGGWIDLDAPAGDGIDSNGDLTIAGGTTIVHGPPSQPEVGLDVNGTFRTDGGFLVVAQINSGMNEVPSNMSSQRSVMLRTNTTISANTLFHIESAAGSDLVTFRPAHRYSAILLSTANLIAGTTYRVYTGGTCTGAEQDGLYSGGVYTPGTLRTTFVSSGTVQIVQF